MLDIIVYHSVWDFKMEIESKSMGIQGRIINIDGVIGEVDIDGIICETSLSFVPNIAIGDYCLVHAGFALKKIAKGCNTTEDYYGNISCSRRAD